MGFLQLSGPDWRRIQNGLGTSFDVDELSTLIEQQYSDLHTAIAWGKPKGIVFSDIAQKANGRGILDQVLTTAADSRPGRPDLRALLFYYSRLDGWDVKP